MSLILASYLMGMHESRVTDCHIKNPEKILEILDDFFVGRTEADPLNCDKQ